MTSVLIHAGCVFYLTGVVWFAQVIQYPLLKLVDPNRYREYYNIHISRIVWMVLPALFLELGTSAFLFFDGKVAGPFSLTFLLLSLFVFISTCYMSMTIYKQMAFQFSEGLINRLLRTNWLRTAAWTLHSASLIAYGIFYSP